MLTVPALAIQLSGLDVEEVLGLTDCGLLVRSLEALGVGLALEETAHLPIPAGVGLEDAQFGRVVGNGRDGRRDGQSAVLCWLVVGVVCCRLPIAQVHTHSVISDLYPEQPDGLV